MADLLLVLLLIGLGGPSDTLSALSFGEQSSLPEWVIQTLRNDPVARRYVPCPCLNPFYQRGDFDGDSKIDYAIVVKEPVSQKRGVLIIHRSNRSVHVIGAGRKLGAGGDDFSWMDAWQVYEKAVVGQGAEAAPPPKLRGDALLLEKTESASGLLWWNGTEYRWYQQGD